MAQNIMRVDSTNDRYVTETMIDLNLNLNEEIDFDFFDNAETPTKQLETKKYGTLCTSQSRSCSPQPSEDDDDVQISQYPLSYNGVISKGIPVSEAFKDINASSDSIEEPLSTGTENDAKFVDHFGECEPVQNSEDLNFKLCESELDNITASTPSTMEKSSQVVSEQTEKSANDGILIRKQYVREEIGVLSNTSFKYGDNLLTCKSNDNNVEGISSKSSCLPQACAVFSLSSEDNELSQLCLNKDKALIKGRENQEAIVSKCKESLEGRIRVRENYKEDTSSKSCRSLKTDDSGGGYDSDEACPFQGNDSDDELLIGVHTLTLIPRENEEESISCTPIACEQAGRAEGNRVIHSTSCEKAVMTARSSSGYSSASCKAHGCIVSRGNTSMGDSRQSTKMKMHTPDMDKLMKSFRKMQSSSQVSFVDKYSTPKKRPRRNMSFSNDQLKRIERENAILLNKIVLQQRARPAVVHKYERRVTSNEINRARQTKKIEYDNEILLRKIQHVKRKSTMSAQSSRCISQASTSQL